MRPEILYPIFSSTKKLPGIGPRIAQHIERLAGPNIVDLLWLTPTGTIDRRNSPKIFDAKPGTIVTLVVRIEKHLPNKIRRQPYKILCSDETGKITIIFFNPKKDYLRSILPEGQERVISGRLEVYKDGPQIIHPDHVVETSQRKDIEIIEPVYGLTEGLSSRVLLRAIRAALKLVPSLPEWLDTAHLKKNSWPNWHDAVFDIHIPSSPYNAGNQRLSHDRLAYDELLANQLTLGLARQMFKVEEGRCTKGNNVLKLKIEERLPFNLTSSQKNAIIEITNDMSSETRMHRLLQGDVGSGKTLVAFMSMLHAIEVNKQAALLAPTEILARQHYATIQGLSKTIDINVVLLTGREKGKVRNEVLDGIANGSINIIVGTHAIFQEKVKFKHLALAVIDEQHRFGVHQRIALASKGHAVDVLVMTATPIPRTLTLTVYGDMEISQLKEKPMGRQPIDTRTISMSRVDSVINSLKRALKKNNKVYWVCPLIAHSEKLDLVAVEARFDYLKSIFGERVGLIHGRMKTDEKDNSMNKFANGGTDILVATTVIEVGVDVPQATIMIIEHAERFGLAQLHQLRGRIGRGTNKSTCILLYSKNLSQLARQRLKILRDTEDGFIISEEDLRLRGAGELLGTKQSGLPQFKIADLALHSHLLSTATEDAKLILSRDPELKSERGKCLRLLLYLFESEAALSLFKSG